VKEVGQAHLLKGKRPDPYKWQYSEIEKWQAAEVLKVAV
jgi:hypothetical protein